MSEGVTLEQKTRTARTLVRPAWDDARAAHLAERAIARRRRRAIVRGAALAAVAIALLVGLAWTRTPVPVGRGSAPVAGAATDRSGVLRFRDGSIATPLDADTELLVSAMEPDRIELVLVRGAARFEVTPGLPRAFRVRAGRATVSVVGTVFTVRRADDGAEVSVDEGHVRIAWDPDGTADLGAGEHGTYPAARSIPTGSALPPVREPAPEPEPEAVAPVPAITPARPRRTPERVEAPAPTPDDAEEEDRTGWRALAEQGRFDEGYGLLLLDRDVLPSRDVEALMQAADCARLSGHPAESLAYLRRALDVGADDPRAPMAAFTLGRVLLQQLDRPRDAADAFARARALSPEGSLASDALAREVEAWHRAGDASRARERAEEYLRLYPDGLRATTVRRHGGLE